MEVAIFSPSFSILKRVRGAPPPPPSLLRMMGVLGVFFFPPSHRNKCFHFPTEAFRGKLIKTNLFFFFLPFPFPPCWREPGSPFPFTHAGQKFAAAPFPPLLARKWPKTPSPLSFEQFRSSCKRRKGSFCPSFFPLPSGRYRRASAKYFPLPLPREACFKKPRPPSFSPYERGKGFFHVFPPPTH